MAGTTQRGRFFVEHLPAPPVGGELPRVELGTAEGHHAMHVLRLGVGDEVELFDGQGGRCVGQILTAKHSHVTVEVRERLEMLRRPSPRVELAFAVPKGNRLDWLLEKATELGAAALVPVRFARSVAGGEELSDSKRERWLGHCVAAAKQCRLDFLPELRPLVPATELAKTIAAGQGSLLAVMGDLGENVPPLREVLLGARPETTVLLLVGPEGDFTSEEVALFRAAGVRSARLGSTTLRVETAAVALLAATVGLLG